MRLSLAIRPYDAVLPLLRGQVRIPGVELEAHEMLNVAMFAGFFRGEYDISEMSLAESVYHASLGDAGFVCIPVFPSRFFRHAYWFCSVASGIGGPDALNGRRIGFQRWVQTAGVWMRNDLVEHHGLDPASAQWHVASVHHWDEAHSAVQPRDGSAIHLLGPGWTAENAHLALLEGRVDVMGTTEVHAGRLLADDRVRRLFPDYRRAEAEYYRRSGVFPIMHLLGLRAEVAERHPELPAQLFRAFAESKAIARRQAAVLPSHVLAWRGAYLDDEARFFGGDPWRHGLEANRAVLEKFISCCYDQGIAARRIAPEELFHPGTWGLEDGA